MDPFLKTGVLQMSVQSIRKENGTHLRTTDRLAAEMEFIMASLSTTSTKSTYFRCKIRLNYDFECSATGFSTRTGVIPDLYQ